MPYRFVLPAASLTHLPLGLVGCTRCSRWLYVAVTRYVDNSRVSPGGICYVAGRRPTMHFLFPFYFSSIRDDDNLYTYRYPSVFLHYECLPVNLSRPRYRRNASVSFSVPSTWKYSLVRASPGEPLFTRRRVDDFGS